MITVLIGTNDVLATLSPKNEGRYRKRQHIPQTPDLAWYLANLSEILRRLSTQTTARIVVIDLPTIGEDLTSDVNARLARYNQGLREVAASFDITVLPLHDRLAGLLPPHHRPAPYDVRGRAMLTAFVWGMVLRRSWDSVAERNGLAVLSDHVHLADRAGAALSQLVADFVTER